MFSRCPPLVTFAQVWPIYCNEETTGPYTRDRSDGDGATIRCRSVVGGKKIVRLYPQVLDILRCFKQQVRTEFGRKTLETGVVCVPWHDVLTHLLRARCCSLITSTGWPARPLRTDKTSGRSPLRLPLFRGPSASLWRAVHQLMKEGLREVSWEPWTCWSCSAALRFIEEARPCISG